MRASLVLIALFFLSLPTAFAGDDSRKAAAGASATPASLHVIGMLHAAQRQQAITLANEFSHLLALPAGTTRQQVEELMFELFQTPAAPATTPTVPRLAAISAPLAQLLATHTAEFQHLLAPVLPQASYNRYIALLNTLDIRAK